MNSSDSSKKGFNGYRLALVLVSAVLLVWPVVVYFPAWFADQAKGHKWEVALICVLLAAACAVLFKLRGRDAFLPAKTVCGIGLAALAANALLNTELWMDMPQLGHALLFGMGVVCLLLSASRWLFGILFSFCCICSFIDAVSRVKYGIILDHDIVVQVMGANMTEVRNYLTWDVVAMLAAVLLFIAGLVWWMLRITRGQGRLRLLGSGVLLLLVSMVARQYTIPLDSKRACAEWPVSLTRRTVKAIVKADETNSRLLRMLGTLPRVSGEQVSISTLKGGEGALCILHIGESVRADHMGIYGYKRDTTPWLKSREGLIRFERCVSTAPYTVYAFVSIMTDACGNVLDRNSEHTEPTVRSVVDLFRACGFKNTTFSPLGREDIARQSMWKPPYETLMDIFSDGGEMVKYSMDPMGQVQQVHDKVRENPGANRFLLINNEGSHAPFAWYDKVNPPFTPASPEGRANRPANHPDMALLAQNAYDNTICYTDEFIRRLLTGLEREHRPFLYVYVSDHGEYVGDDGGRWERGMVKEDYYQTHGCLVPLLVVASPEFEALHPHFREALENLRANRAVPASQDNIIHTLLGVFGISHKSYDPAYDLSSRQVRPYSGEQPETPTPPAPTAPLQ